MYTLQGSSPQCTIPIFPSSLRSSDLSRSLYPFRRLMNLVGEEGGVRYGQLVMPSVVNNFGPMYMSRITRLN